MIPLVSRQLFSNANSGEITSIVGGNIAETIPFYEGTLSALNDCDGGDRTGLVSSPTIENIPQSIEKDIKLIKKTNCKAVFIPTLKEM